MTAFVSISVLLISLLAVKVYSQNEYILMEVTVTPQSAHSILVQWNHTRSNQSVYRYKVFYRKKDAGSFSIKSIGNNSHQTVIDGLKPYTLYEVQMILNTTSGSSNRSTAVYVRTEEAVPSELPVITTIQALSCCSLYLTWNTISPANMNGRLLGYAVFYLKASNVADYQTKHLQVRVPIKYRNTTLSGLQPYTEYIVGVIPYNSKDLNFNLLTLEKIRRIQTHAGAPSAVSQLRAAFTSSSKLHIQWALITADKANGVVIGYRYIVFDGQSTVVANGTVSNTTISKTIANLVQCADYTIHVKAWTAAGIGNNSVFNWQNPCDPPKIVFFKRLAVAAPTTFIVLPCKTTGFPKPTVFWTLNDKNKTKLETGYAVEHHGGRLPANFVKRIHAHESNGSLTINYAESSDNGLYTCYANSTQGLANNSTRLNVSGGVISVIFHVQLTNEQYSEDLSVQKSSRFKALSSTIKTAVLSVYRSFHLYSVYDVVIFFFRKGSVIVTFDVKASYTPSKDVRADDIEKAVVGAMVTSTQNGTLGPFPVGVVVVSGTPPPPRDLVATNIYPTYVLLSWNRPQYYKAYEITQYSIQYRKHGETTYKTVQSVSNNETRLEGTVRGLDPGGSYYVRVTSHREISSGTKKNSPEIEVNTPNPMLNQVLLTIVLPIGLAVIIAFIILVIIRPRCREDTVEDSGMRNTVVQYGPREENPYDIRRLVEEFPCRWKEIPRDELQVGKELGAGAFGCVMRGDIQRDGKSFPCAVKMLKRFATERERRDLFNELSIMTQAGNHPNVVSLIGACTVDGPLWVVVKLAENGCLLEYLYQHRKPDYIDHAYMNFNGSGSDVKVLDDLQKMKLAHGIARGMAHLEKMKCVHRDLAARNVLLGKNMVPMVSDFGLARDIYESGMYEDVRGGKRPVRWMAPESIEDYTCTSKSDVWSFGVTLWEIETAGTVPYAGIESGLEILSETRKGYRLEQPVGCDDKMYEMMLSTWRANPLDRPTFHALTEEIEARLHSMADYLEIQIDEEYESAISAYDEVHISQTDLEEANANDATVPTANGGANDGARVLSLGGPAASVDTQL